MKQLLPLYKFTIHCFFFLVLLSCFNLAAQSDKSTLTQIQEVRIAQDFDPQNSTYIDLLLQLARDNIRLNSDSTVVLLEEAYDLSKISNYRKGESMVLSNYGYYFSEQGEMEKAYDYNRKALEIANRYNLDRQKMMALNNIGNDYAYKGDYANALTQYLEALDIAKRKEDFEMMSVLNVNISDLYHENEDYETALIFLEKGKQLSIEHEDQNLLAKILLNMSAIYTIKEDFNRADALVNKCIEIFKEENSLGWLSHAYGQKGKIALKENNVLIALEWYTKSKVLCDKMDFGIGYMDTYKGLAEAHFGLGKLDSAETYALRGLQVSKELNVASAVKESNLILSKIYHKRGDINRAYVYQSDYIDLFEKGSVEKFKKGLGVLRSKIQFENQKKQLIENQNKAITKQRNYIYTVIAAFLLVSILLISIYRNNKLQKKHTQELQEKQKELLLHQVELCKSNKTKDKLFSIIAHDLKGPINSFYGLMKISATPSFSKKDYDGLMPKALNDIQGVSELLNNLLVWAKSQMDGITLKQENIDINLVAKKTMLVLTPLADKKEIALINTIPEGTISYSDRNHLRIILRNLISNAIKFTNNKGTITVGTKKIQNELQVNITDNGLGMNSETRAMLFKASHMKSTYGTNLEKGTGLGLSICKEMVESNGGRIWVDSILDKGTSIHFTLPLPLPFKTENNT